VDFTAHVIGFDVTEEQSIGLRCLAEKTGGIYVTASNAEDLSDAMSAAKETVTDTAEIILGEATLSVPATVPAGSRFDVEWTGPENPSDKLIIVHPETGRTSSSRYVSLSDDNIAELRAPEKIGTYTVEYRTRKFEVAWTGPGTQGDRIRIRDPKDTKNLDSNYVDYENGEPEEMRAPETAGEFEVQYSVLHAREHGSRHGDFDNICGGRFADASR